MKRTIARRALVMAALSSTLTLIGAGALLNAHGGALSVPDWPLSYGRILLPDWPGNLRYEQSHRLLAALTLLILPGSLIWLGRMGPSTLRRAGVIIFSLYALQIFLGGAVVLLVNPPLVGAIHVVVAQIVGALVVSMSWNAWNSSSAVSPGESRLPLRRARAVPVLLLAQIVLGALSRHAFFQTQFIVSLLIHMANGVGLLVLIPATTIPILRRSGSSTLRKPAATLLALIVLQVVVAAPLLIVSPEPFDDEPAPHLFPELHVAHMILGTLLLGTSVVLRRRIDESHDPVSPTTRRPEVPQP